MNFTNQSISPAELPSIEEVSFHPLERKYSQVERIAFAITLAALLVFAVPLFYFIDPLREPFIITIALILYLGFAVIYWVSTSIDYSYSGYALREKDILYRSGWFIRKQKIVMLNRVQHISVQSGPIERKFGLASVSVYTAGASQADFTIKGIKAEMAEKIKEWANHKADGNRRE